MKVTLKIPRITLNTEEVTVTKWYRAVGEPFYDLETEKATNEVEAPADGRLLEILLPAGSESVVGAGACVAEL